MEKLKMISLAIATVAAALGFSALAGFIQDVPEQVAYFTASIGSLYAMIQALYVDLKKLYEEITELFKTK